VCGGENFSVKSFSANHIARMFPHQTVIGESLQQMNVEPKKVLNGN
jgi:hypothetical protein